MAKLVRARIKREGWPDWFICCAPMREKVDAEIRENKIHIVELGTAFMAEVECSTCGRIIDNVKYIRTTAKRRIVIAVDAYDIDETGVPDGNYVTFAAAEQP